jgi:hypothetical protein
MKGHPLKKSRRVLREHPVELWLESRVPEWLE